MKKKQLTKKFELNKTTIVALQDKAQAEVRGGGQSGGLSSVLLCTDLFACCA